MTRANNRREIPVWVAQLTSAEVLVALCLCLAYATLRLDLNTQYKGATWEQLVELRAPKPFGLRVLVPALVGALRSGLGGELRDWFVLTEFIAALLLLLGVYRVCLTFPRVDPTQAKVRALCFFAFLPWMYLLRTPWPIFYPYDTPAMAFIAWGLLYLREARWLPFLLVLGVGTANRESTVLLVFVAGLTACTQGRFRRSAIISGLGFLTYVSARVLILLLVSVPEGQGSLQFHVGERLRIVNNLDFLGTGLNTLRVLGYLGGLPVLMLLRLKQMTVLGQTWVLAALAYGVALLFVGNVYEPRIFGEPALLVFLALASSHPVADGDPAADQSS